MLSGTNFNSSDGHVSNASLHIPPNSNGASCSSVASLSLNNNQRLSSKQVAEYREILLSKVPLSQLKTLINYTSANPLPVAVSSKNPIRRVKRKYKKSKPELETVDVEDTAAAIHDVQYDYPIARIIIGNMKVSSPLFPVNRTSFVKIDNAKKKLDYWVQQRIHEWHVSVYSVQLSEIRSIILNNCVISLVVFRPATVSASYKETGQYSPDIAICEVSSSLMHEIIMTSSSDATSFVCTLACIYPPILTRMSYGASHFHHTSPPVQQPSDVDAYPGGFSGRHDSTSDIIWATSFRPLTTSQPGNSLGFPSMYMQSSYQQLETPCPVPQTFSRTTMFSNSFEMLFCNEALSHPIVDEGPNKEVANSKNSSEVSDKQIQFSGQYTSKSYADTYESHYAMTVPAAATPSDYVMKYINGAQCELFGVKDMEKEMESNKHGLSVCYGESDDFNALPNIPLCGADNMNVQSGSGMDTFRFQYDLAGWGAGVEHLTK